MLSIFFYQKDFCSIYWRICVRYIFDSLPTNIMYPGGQKQNCKSHFEIFRKLDFYLVLFSLCVSLYVSLFLSFSLSLSPPLSLSLFLSLSLSLSLSSYPSLHDFKKILWLQTRANFIFFRLLKKFKIHIPMLAIVKWIWFKSRNVFFNNRKYLNLEQCTSIVTI